MTEQEWKTYLEQVGGLIKRAQGARGPADILPVEQFVLKHGVFFDRWVVPLERMTPNECYANCARYALAHDMLYCEGVASGIIPNHHAWCYDTKTRLVHDPTWWQIDRYHDESPPTYFGVAIAASDLWVHLAATAHYSIFDSDWNIDFAVLRGKTVLPFVELVR